MGVETVLDLLHLYPRRIHDRTAITPIDQLEIGTETTVFGSVVKVSSRFTKTRKKMVVATVEGGGARLEVTFFNQPWREKQLAEGTEVAMFGKVETFAGARRMTNPVVDVIGRAGEARTGRIVAVYPQSAKADLSSWEIAPAVARALEFAGEVYDPLDPTIRGPLRLVDRTTALRDVHRPATAEDHRRAERRLRFDEFLVAQVGLVARKRALAAAEIGVRHAAAGPLVGEFLARLPFAVTADQSRAIDEIRADLARPAPMHRLLQGDVGSGKTVVALAAMLVAVEGGFQAALMAPTAVLAEQLFAVAVRTYGDLVPGDGAPNLLGETPTGVRLLTNRTSAKERAEIAAGLRDGTVHIVIGTHALLYGETPFTNLGLIVIDEHHRFGVEQRDVLKQRATELVPDVLVMTATPIPRTAALLVYGDLDISVLAAMPSGREPVTTEVLRRDTREADRAYERIRTEVAAGRQAYVVCPLVEGSEKIEAKAATERADELREGALATLRIGLLHGQMPAADKEAVMEAFRARELDVLVATTVIEVGVDVPNATVMVIEDAQRFGLAQLHQLRGRVGRGGGESWCYLVADTTTEDAAARMEAMAETTDGFVLAERDLEIRGSGQVFGERQSGQRVDRHLRLARLPRDEKYVAFARSTAEALLDADPDLADHRPLAEEVEDLLGDDVEYLFKS
jgi:ATP-dependent DNA helicase RecG